MSDIKIQPSATGSATVTLTAPVTNTARTITFPDSTSTLLASDGSAANLTAIPAGNITGTLPALSAANLTAIPAGNLTGTVADARISALTSSKLTGTLPAISAANLTNVPKDITVGGRKNMVINGAMQVAQRGTSETGYTTTGYYTCDRWHHDKAAATGTFTQTQEADAPDGFKNSLKINCTTAGSSGDYNAIQTKLESQDTAHLAYGTSSAKSVTLSFWVKVSQTGTMQFNLIHHADAGSRQISYLYTISAANTWEKKTVTFPGDTVRVGDDDSTQGFYLEWFLSSYGGRTGSAVQTSWGAYNNPARFEGATIMIGDSTSDTWQITGVQLEVGSTATDFEGRSYGEELSLCERYYHRHKANIAGAGICAGTIYSTTAAAAAYRYPTIMRGNPTLSYSAVGDFRVLYTTTKVVTAIDGIETVSGVRLWFTSSGMTAGNGMMIDANNPNCWLAFDAEL